MVVLGAFSVPSRLAPSSSVYASTSVQASRPSVSVALPSSPAIRVPSTSNSMITPGPVPVQPSTSLPASRIDPAPTVRAELERRPTGPIAPMTSSGPARVPSGSAEQTYAEATGAASSAAAAPAYQAGGGGGGAPVAPPLRAFPGLERAASSGAASAPSAAVLRALEAPPSSGPSPVILAAGAVAAGLVLWRLLHG